MVKTRDLMPSGLRPYGDLWFTNLKTAVRQVNM
jgi:hypothetical protein